MRIRNAVFEINFKFDSGLVPREKVYFGIYFYRQMWNMLFNPFQVIFLFTLGLLISRSAEVTTVLEIKLIDSYPPLEDFRFLSSD